MNEMQRRIAAIALPILLSACGGSAPGGNNDVAGANASTPLAGARIGGPFSLTDQAGHTVTDQSFAGQYRVMYFGYTSCPDVCPTDAQSIGQGLRLFEQSDPAKAARVTPVFVSVDPTRDTPAVLRQFVSAFHPRMVGLTGTPQAIAEVAREYAVSFSTTAPAPQGTAAVDGPGLGGGYRQGGAPRADGPGLGGGYRNGDGPGLGGGYGPQRVADDGPGAGGGYRQGAADGPGLGGGYRHGDRRGDGPGPGGGDRSGDGPGLGGGYRHDGPGNGGGYLVAHTRIAYLMGPDGRPIALIPEDQGPQAVAAALARWVQ